MAAGFAVSRSPRPFDITVLTLVSTLLVVEVGGYSAVSGPDLFREVGELLEVGLAEAHLLLPAGGVDGEQGVQVPWVDVEAVRVELALGREDADRGLDPLDFAVLELHEPDQGAEVVAVAGPEEVAVR